MLYPVHRTCLCREEGLIQCCIQSTGPVYVGRKVTYTVLYLVIGPVYVGRKVIYTVLYPVHRICLCREEGLIQCCIKSLGSVYVGRKVTYTVLYPVHRTCLCREEGNLYSVVSSP